jgi:hypothetical protein
MSSGVEFFKYQKHFEYKCEISFLTLKNESSPNNTKYLSVVL